MQLLALSKSRYWENSRTPIMGFVFVMPVWLLYELCAYNLNAGWSGNLRTGIDLLIKRTLEIMHIPGWFSIAVFLLILIPYGIKKKVF